MLKVQFEIDLINYQIRREGEGSSYSRLWLFVSAVVVVDRARRAWRRERRRYGCSGGGGRCHLDWIWMWLNDLVGDNEVYILLCIRELRWQLHMRECETYARVEVTLPMDGHSFTASESTSSNVVRYRTLWKQIIIGWIAPQGSVWLHRPFDGVLRSDNYQSCW